MKSTYIQPKMIAVKLQNPSHLMEGTTISNTSATGTDGEVISYLDLGAYEARVKGTNLWDDEW